MTNPTYNIVYECVSRPCMYSFGWNSSSITLMQESVLHNMAGFGVISPWGNLTCICLPVKIQRPLLGMTHSLFVSGLRFVGRWLSRSRSDGGVHNLLIISLCLGLLYGARALGRLPGYSETRCQNMINWIDFVLCIFQLMFATVSFVLVCYLNKNMLLITENINLSEY